LVQDRGAGMLKYPEDLSFAANNDIGPKDYFEIVCGEFHEPVLMLECVNKKNP
jgi:hypothetical protein